MRICTAFIYRVFRNNGVFFKNFHYFETSPSQAVSTGLLVTVKFSWSICRRGMGCSWQLKSTILPEHPLCGCKNLFFLIAINFLWPCLSVRRVGLLVGRLVGLFVIIYWKGRKFYFHAPNGPFVFSSRIWPRNNCNNEYVCPRFFLCFTTIWKNDIILEYYEHKVPR